MRVALLAGYPLHLVPGYEEEKPRGHYATWLPQLSEAFSATPGFDFHWISVSRKVRKDQPVVWRNQTFHTIYIPEKFRPLRLYTRDIRLIRKKLDELRPNLLHAWGTEDCYGLAAAKSGRDFLLSMQGLLGFYTRACKSHILEHLQARIEKYIFGRTRFVTVESTWGCQILKREIPRAKVFRVEYGVDGLFFHTEWTPNRDQPVAIYVGTVDHRKGLHDAIRAFAAPELRNAQLWVVGDQHHSLAQRLRKQSTDNVRWLGRVDRQTTANLMAQAWCLVLPTRGDTSPNVVKEARVIGMPVITSPHGGQTDYIINGQTGFIVEPGDIPALTNHLASLLNDLDTTRRLGTAKHHEQREWFRPENTAEAFLQIYRELGECVSSSAPNTPALQNSP